MTETTKPRRSVFGDNHTKRTSIELRNGQVVPFEPMKIRNAILKAGYATGQFDWLMADTLTRRVVEQVQDIVEDVLIKSPFTRTAKA